MTDIAMTYAVNPFYAVLKTVGAILLKIGKGFIAAREAQGRAVAAHHLAAMGYYKEARDLMLEDKK